MPSAAELPSAPPRHGGGVIYCKTPPLHPHLSPHPPLLLTPSFPRSISCLLVAERGFHFRECLLLWPEMAELKCLKQQH